LKLHELSPVAGSTHVDKRKGRGHGTGNGKTAGRGHKGQKARSGSKVKGFEGGQTPFFRRLPKHGFKHHVDDKVVDLTTDIISKLIELGRLTSDISRQDLIDAHLINRDDIVKLIFGKSEVQKPFKIEVDKASKTAEKYKK